MTAPYVPKSHSHMSAARCVARCELLTPLHSSTWHMLSSMTAAICLPLPTPVPSPTKNPSRVPAVHVEMSHVPWACHVNAEAAQWDAAGSGEMLRGRGGVSGMLAELCLRARVCSTARVLPTHSRASPLSTCTPSPLSILTPWTHPSLRSTTASCSPSHPPSPSTPARHLSAAYAPLLPATIRASQTARGRWAVMIVPREPSPSSQICACLCPAYTTVSS